MTFSFSHIVTKYMLFDYQNNVFSNPWAFHHINPLTIEEFTHPCHLKGKVLNDPFECRIVLADIGFLYKLQLITEEVGEIDQLAPCRVIEPTVPE